MMLKRTFTALLSLAVVAAALSLPGNTAIASASGTATNPRVLLDGVEVVSDAPAEKIGDRTFLPFRAIGEALGGEVSWDQETLTAIVRKDGHEVRMTIGSTVYTIDGSKLTMDAVPFQSGSKTLVPVRYLAAALGLDVSWDQTSYTVLLSRKGSTASPDLSGAISNGGPVAYQDGWYYFVNPDGWYLYKMDSNFAHVTRLLPDSQNRSVECVSVVGDWVYFIYPTVQNTNAHDHIARCRKDGSQLTALHDDWVQRSYRIIGDWIYYSNSDHGGRLYRMRLDGSERQLLVDQTYCGYPSVVGDRLYFCSSRPGQTYSYISSCKLDGSDLIDLTPQPLSKQFSNLWNLTASDQSILFHATDWDNWTWTLYRMPLSGGTCELVMKQPLTTFAGLWDGWVYYQEGDGTGGPIRRFLFADPTQQVTVLDGKYVDFDVVGGWIFYRINGEAWTLHRIKTDGTSRAKMYKSVWKPE